MADSSVCGDADCRGACAENNVFKQALLHGARPTPRLPATPASASSSVGHLRDSPASAPGSVGHLRDSPASVPRPVGATHYTPAPSDVQLQHPSKVREAPSPPELPLAGTATACLPATPFSALSASSAGAMCDSPADAAEQLPHPGEAWPWPSSSSLRTPASASSSVGHLRDSPDAVPRPVGATHYLPASAAELPTTPPKLELGSDSPLSKEDVSAECDIIVNIVHADDEDERGSGDADDETVSFADLGDEDYEFDFLEEEQDFGESEDEDAPKGGPSGWSEPDRKDEHPACKLRRKSPATEFALAQADRGAPVAVNK